MPGGRVEEGEVHEHAVVREVSEETRLRVRVCDFLGVERIFGEGFSYDIHEFLCALESPEEVARAGDDAADVCWAGIEDLAALGVTPKVAVLVRRALEVVERDGVGGKDAWISRRARS